MTTHTGGRLSVYEIGYLLSGIPEEKVTDLVSEITGVITKAGGSVIADEAPRHEHLAYTMRKKTVSGSYEKYDSAYFGWIKFDGANESIEGIKKAIEAMPNVLRILVTTTVRESTYLGKRASQIAAAFSTSKKGSEVEAVIVEKKIEAPASIEELDKSIDEMVKEV